MLIDRNLCLAPPVHQEEKEDYEAETENTQSHGQAGLSYRLRQIYAPQGRIEPPATQQVARGNPFDGQKVSIGYQRYTPDETPTPLLLINRNLNELNRMEEKKRLCQG
jgi:hypothetical protein